MTLKIRQGVFYSADFFFTQSFGNPEDFYLYQTGLLLNGGYAFNENFSVMSSARVTLLDNFDKFNYLVDGEDVSLPRVRTRVREYVSRKRCVVRHGYFYITKTMLLKIRISRRMQVT